MGIRHGWLGMVGSGLLLLACGSDSATGPDGDLVNAELQVVEAEAFLLDGVHLVHTADGTVERDRSVLVEDGRITQVAAAGDIAVPVGAIQADVAGAWVTPGLIDMHVHLRSSEAEAYVRSGITTVRNMWGYANLGALVEAIDRGDRIGPRVLSLSSGLDGPPAYWPETQLITDPALADSLVGAIEALGYSEVKIYQDLSRPVYDSIVAATNRRGMTHAGHKPSPVPVERVIRSGQRSIEHLGGFMGRSPAQLGVLTDLALEHETWISPTLAVQRTLQGDTPAAGARRDVVASLHEAGVRLLIGTDAGIDATAAGTSLVEEMALFAEAGVPLDRMLRMVTVEAAEYLGVEDDRGRLEVGFRADLTLFSRNPLDRLDHVRSVQGVLMGSRLITPDPN